MATHRVYYGKGAQTLYTVPHKGGNPQRVASATYSILDARYGESSDSHVIVAAGTAATVDAVSTTLTSKAGSNANDHKVITVTSTASVQVNHAYLLTDPKGRAELVRVAAVVSATELLTDKDIAGQFATGSTFKGVEVAAVFPALAANDDQKLDGMPWLIVWEFAGFTPVRESVHLERAEEGQLATRDDLYEEDPEIASMDADKVVHYLSSAHKTFRVHMLMAGAHESDMLTGPAGRLAVTKLAAHYAFRSMDGAVEITKAEQYLSDYNEIRAALQVGALKPQVVNLDKETATVDKRNPAKLFVANGFGY